MTILLSIFSAVTFIGLIIAGVSLRKYQLKSYNLQVEQKKIKDDYEQRLHDDKQLLHEHQTQLTQLQNKISDFDSERDKIYHQAFKEGESQVLGIEEQYKTEINQYKDQIDQLSFKHNEVLAENQKILLENKSLLESISEIQNNIDNAPQKEGADFNAENIIQIISKYQAEQFEILDQEIEFDKMQFAIDGKIANNISIKQIISSLDLADSSYSYIKYRSESQEDVDYIIISSGNDVAYLIDARFSDFLLEKKELLKTPDEQLTQELRTLFEKRLSSINGSDKKQKIIDIINESGDFSKVEKLYACIYVPSGNYIDYLYDINASFFEKAKELNTFVLNPAGLVNLIHFAKSILLSQYNIISTQYIVDNIVENFNLDQYVDTSTSSELETETFTTHEEQEEDEDDKNQENNESIENKEASSDNNTKESLEKNEENQDKIDDQNDDSNSSNSSSEDKSYEQKDEGYEEILKEKDSVDDILDNKINSAFEHNNIKTSKDSNKEKITESDDNKFDNAKDPSNFTQNIVSNQPENDKVTDLKQENIIDNSSEAPQTETQNIDNNSQLKNNDSSLNSILNDIEQKENSSPTDHENIAQTTNEPQIDEVNTDSKINASEALNSNFSNMNSLDNSSNSVANMEDPQIDAQDIDENSTLDNSESSLNSILSNAEQKEISASFNQENITKTTNESQINEVNTDSRDSDDDASEASDTDFSNINSLGNASNSVANVDKFQIGSFLDGSSDKIENIDKEDVIKTIDSNKNSEQNKTQDNNQKDSNKKKFEDPNFDIDSFLDS